MKRKEIIKRAITALAIFESEALICAHNAKTIEGAGEVYDIAQRLHDASEVLKGQANNGK